MSKGGTSAPPSIDPNALAASQGQSNIATANAQSALNNVNTYSPLGSSVFTQGPDGRWGLNQQLGPYEQGVYNSQLNLGGNLANLGNNVANIVTGPANYGANALGGAFNSIFPSTLNPSSNLQTGLDFGSLGRLPSSTADFSNQVDAARNAAYKQQTGYLDPQFAQKGSDLRQQLADEGIGVGTDAYSRAQGDLGRQSTLAYQQAADAATTAGQAEQAKLFGEDLAARQQGASELQAGGAFRNQALQQMWQNPLTALQSLSGIGTGILGSAAQDLTTLNPLSGFQWAGSLPTFGGSPTSVSPANVVGAGQVASQNAANRFAAGNTLNNTLFNGLGSLGGALGLGNGGLGSFFGSLLGGSGASALTGTAAGSPFLIPGGATIGSDIATAGTSLGGGGLLGFLGLV
jgi:hypothetical protein